MRWLCTCVTVATTLISGSAITQDTGEDDFSIRELSQPDIRGLVLLVRDTTAQTGKLSGTVRDMVAKSDGDLVMRETATSIVLSVTSDVLFRFDSVELTKAARETLTRIAAILVESGTAVVVAGHTDSIGSETYNQQLSEKRAQAVVHFLTGSEVPSSQLHAVGHGESRPIAANMVDGADHPEGRARNRRVEFILSK